MGNDAPAMPLTRAARRASATRSQSGGARRSADSATLGQPQQGPRFLSRITGIRNRLVFMSLIPVIAFAVLGSFGIKTFNEVRIQGDNYKRITLSKDVVSDTLPPPMFLLEAYLTVLQLSDSTNARNEIALKAQLDSLFKEYRIRHKFWKQQSLDESVRVPLLVESFEPGDQFIKLVNTKFIPAIEAKSYGQARILANGEIKVEFLKHRIAIDNALRLSGEIQAKVETETSEIIRKQKIILGSIFAGLILLTLLLGFIIARSIIKPINRLEQVAHEDLPKVLEQARTVGFEDPKSLQLIPLKLGQRDELGRAAFAFNTVV